MPYKYPYRLIKNVDFSYLLRYKNIYTNIFKHKMIVYYLILLGFIFLSIGAELFVRNSVALAHKLNIPKLIIGITIVTFGTTTPELFVSIKASLANSPGITLGNIIGSNISNMALILASAILISPIMLNNKKEFLQNYVFLFISIFLLSLFLLTKEQLDFRHGIVFIIIFLTYLSFSYINAKKYKKTHTYNAKEKTKLKKLNWFTMISFIVLGLCGLLLGSKLLVENAIVLAQNFNISEEIIGLTIVAVGTSLPELAVAVVAANNKQHQIILGNVIGSNIWNILFILGLSSIGRPIQAAPQILRFDLFILIFITILVFLFVLKGKKLSRIEGLFLLSCFILYIFVQHLIATNVLFI
jgi:cation:H+ antiporter